jgi:hypothetical protein
LDCNQSVVAPASYEHRPGCCPDVLPEYALQVAVMANTTIPGDAMLADLDDIVADICNDYDYAICTGS